MDGQGNAANQIPYGAAYQPDEETLSLASALGLNPSYLYPENQPAQHQFTFEQLRQQQDRELEQQLQTFWAAQYQQIDNLCDFKNQSLPLARIKKIMKSDEDVKMISAEAPVVFAKACEMFILELTLRAWNQTEENRRRTLQRNDISAAVARTDLFDFLVDIVPRDEDVLAGIQRGGVPVPVAAPTEGIPYYPIHAPPHQQYAQAGSSSSGVMMDESELDPNAYVYPDYMPAGIWPQPGEGSSSGN